jgi:hypothetical protein
MIPAWRVGEIGLQCRVARFVISTTLELTLVSGESQWGLKGKYDECWGKPGAPQAKEECLMWSSRWAGRVLIAMAEH